MSNMDRQIESWTLAERRNNTRRGLGHAKSTRVTLERVWERPGEIAWVNFTVRRGNEEMQLPPADLDELIDLLQRLRDGLAPDELAGPEQITKYNDQVRAEKRAQARANQVEEPEQCA